MGDSLMTFVLIIESFQFPVVLLFMYVLLVFPMLGFHDVMPYRDLSMNFPRIISSTSYVFLYSNFYTKSNFSIVSVELIGKIYFVITL